MLTDSFSEYKKDLYKKPGASDYLINDAKILEALILSDNPLRIIDIQKKTSIKNRGVIKKHLDRLVDIGWVKKIVEEGRSRPRYNITEIGRQVYTKLRVEAEREGSHITDVIEVDTNKLKVKTIKDENVRNFKVKNRITVTTAISGLVYLTSIEGFPTSVEKPKLYQVSANRKPKEGSIVLEFTPEYFAHSGTTKLYWRPICHICGGILPDRTCPQCGK